MSKEDLFNQVSITGNGAICLGDSVVCDGFAPGFKAAVFTHIHSDHISSSFKTCMHQYNVYSTKITVDLLEALTDNSYAIHTQLHRLSNKESKMIRHNSTCDFLTLYESKHMLGASQVLLTTHDKLKILYSGDIAPGDSPPECDVLVLDSTHGSPVFDKKIDSPSLERRLGDIVVESLESNKPVRIQAHRGQLQEIMHMLTENPRIPHDTLQFLASAEDIRVAGIYSNNNMRIRPITDRASYEAEEIIYGNHPWIEFSANFKKSANTDSRIVPITVSGRIGPDTMIRGEYGHWFASNKHAEFSEILDYVKKANPKAVVTDNTRSKYGRVLADEINKRLGISARTLPV